MTHECANSEIALSDAINRHFNMLRWILPS